MIPRVNEMSSLHGSSCFFNTYVHPYLGKWSQFAGHILSDGLVQPSTTQQHHLAWQVVNEIRSLGGDGSDLEKILMDFFPSGNYMDVSENSGFSPQIIHCNGVFPLFSPSILGYHYFWKHLYIWKVYNTVLLMLQKSQGQPTVWMVLNTLLNTGIYLPTSTGYIAGFLPPATIFPPEKNWTNFWTPAEFKGFTYKNPPNPGKVVIFQTASMIGWGVISWGLVVNKPVNPGVFSEFFEDAICWHSVCLVGEVFFYGTMVFITIVFGTNLEESVFFDTFNLFQPSKKQI